MVTLLLAAALQTGCSNPALAALRPPAAPDTAPSVDDYNPLRGFDPAVFLGIGRLHPADDASAWHWWHAIRLPLFAMPAGRPEAWIVDGWWVPATGDVEPLSLDGMVETGYEVPSFIALAHRDDGWLRIRVAPGDAGRVWVPDCWLAGGTNGLRFESWADRFMSDEISPLYFRASARHPLRDRPEDEGPVTHWVPADQNAYMIDPLEIQGDWMRARVTEPSVYCGEEDSATVRTVVGWVRWRDSSGPVLWYHTRGC